MTTPTLVSNMTSCMVCANIKCLAQRSEAVPLQLCSDCSGVAYCGDKCHQKGWVTHKVVCHKMKGASWDKKIALVTSMISQSTSLGSKEGENNSNQGWPQGLPSPSFSRSDHHRGEEEQHSPTSPWPPDRDGQLNQEYSRDQGRTSFHDGKAASIPSNRQSPFSFTRPGLQYASPPSHGQVQPQQLGVHQQRNMSPHGLGMRVNQSGAGYSMEENFRGGGRGGVYQRGGGYQEGYEGGGYQEGYVGGGYQGGYGGGGYQGRYGEGGYRGGYGGGGYNEGSSGYQGHIGGAEDSQFLDKLGREKEKIIEENIGLKWKLQEKEKNEIKNQLTNQKLLDDLIALRHEKARMEEEYEREIGRVKETEKRWRIQLKNIKEKPFKEEKEKNVQVKPYKEEKEKNVQALKISSETEDSSIKKAAVDPDEPKPSSSVKKLTGRLEKIRSLELRTDLCEYENLKLQTLRDQEEFWKQSNMEEVGHEMSKLQVPSKRRAKSLPDKVSVPQRTMRVRPKSAGTAEAEPIDQTVPKPIHQTEAEPIHQTEAEVIEETEVDPVDLDLSLEIKSSQKSTLEEKYTDPDHLKQVKNLSKRISPVFEKVSGSIPPKKNPELARLLHSCKDPERLLKLWKVSQEDYENLTGKKFDDNPEIDDRYDTLDDLSTLVKSSSWMNQLGGVYNKLALFSDAYPEFR